jgi:hypothetical protein
MDVLIKVYGSSTLLASLPTGTTLGLVGALYTPLILLLVLLYLLLLQLAGVFVVQTRVD